MFDNLWGRCQATFENASGAGESVDYPESSAVKALSRWDDEWVEIKLYQYAFKSKYRYIFEVDGQYAGETHRGTSYYNSTKDNGDGTQAIWRKVTPGNHQVTVHIAGGEPGQTPTAKQLLVDYRWI